MKLSIRKTALAAFITTFLVYLRTLSCDFVNLDDPYYVYLNPGIRVLDWQLVVEAFTTSYMGWWMPLTWISFAVDYFIWGLNPLGYHLTNSVLHASNVALVVLVAHSVLKRLLGEKSAFQGAPSVTIVTPFSGYGFWRQGEYLYPVTLVLAGLLWGLHPLRVESVAWVTERKDVLSGLFSLLSILYYLRSCAVLPDNTHNAILSRNYLFALLFFLLALFAKPVSVVLPVMFLVLDWYPLGRMEKGKVFALVVEKWPFFVVSIMVAMTTVYLAAGETILVSLDDYPLYKRFLVAGYAITEYIRMSVYPIGLVHLHVLPITFSPVHYVSSVITFTVICCSILLRRKYPWFLATLLLYLLPLLPVLGFIQNGTQSHADRFSYLPSLFPSILVAVLFVAAYIHFFTRRLYSILFVAAVASLIILYSSLTFNLIGAWKNSDTLWSRLISIQPLGRAYYYRGEYYLRIGKYNDAINDLQSMIRHAKVAGVPEIWKFYALLGDALSQSGRNEEAVKEYTTAIELQPAPNYYYHRGLALSKIGRVSEAEHDFRVAGSATEPIIWELSKP